MALRTRTNIIAARQFTDQENAPVGKGKIASGPVTRRAALGDITSNTLASRQRDAVLKKEAPIKPLQVQKAPVIPKPTVSSAGVTSRLPRPKAVTQKTATVKPFPAGRTLGLPKNVEVLKPAAAEKPVPVAVIQPLAPSKPVEDIDKNDEGKLFLVPEYANDIYNYLRQLESKYEVEENYLGGQDVTGRMRATLVDWLVDVQQQYHLFAETLHLCVAIIDMFLQEEVTNVTRENLQLVGVSAMMVACKYEETYSPDISDFVYITDSTYTKQEILHMEKFICAKLDFRLGRPLSLHFLRRYSKAANASSLQHSIAKYFLELALLEYKLVHVKPSLVAAVACLISLCVTDKKESSLETLWTDCLEHYSTYKLEDLKPIIPKLANTILKAPISKLQSVQKKYSSSKLQKVSLLPALESDVMKKLANES